MKKAGKDILLGKILPSNPSELVKTRPKKKDSAPSPDRGSVTPGKGDQSTILSAKRMHVGAGRLLDRAAELCGIEEDIYALTDRGTAQKLISCARYLVSTGGQRLSPISVLSNKEIVLVADNEFYSENNAYELMIRGFSYLMRIELSTKWVRPYLKKHMAELECGSTCCSDDGYVTGITIPVVRTYTKADGQGKKQSVRKKCYLHSFLDSRKRSTMNAAQNMELQELKSQLEDSIPIESLKVDAQAKIRRLLTKTDGRHGITYSFNDEEICRDKESNGIFAVMGYGRQSIVQKTQMAFSTYINREHIENHFRAEKQTVDGNTVRSWYGDNYMGRMLIQFVALCYEDCLWQKNKRD